MKVAIAGAHGQIARRLIPRLTAAGDEAIGLIRNPDHREANQNLQTLLRQLQRARFQLLYARPYFGIEDVFTLLLEKRIIRIETRVQGTDAVEFPEHDRRKKMVHCGSIIGMALQNFFESGGGVIVVGVVIMLEACLRERVIFDADHGRQAMFCGLRNGSCRKEEEKHP